MPCSRCQHDNPPESNFCLGCGAPLGLTCLSCGVGLPSASRFCNKCGAPVKTDATDQRRYTSPQSYTPKHLAEKILTSKSTLEGERKQVTVLFADLKGSMELLADRDPEDARTLLDPVLQLMMEAVHRYEGTVNQVMGDGIMALFGAPLAHEDHAVRACYAALRMQESAQRYSEAVRRSHGIEVQIRVGLNSGDVVVRSIGSDLRMDYTAVGQTTHLAARMEQLANPGSIRLTGATLRLAEGYVEVKPLGPVPVKGLSEPVEVYEATGAGAVRSRLQAAAARGLTRFVGRDTEVEQLRKAVEQARAGHGQLVAAVGEPGVGKSRLFYEFTHSHRTQDWVILESSSVSYGKATTYLPVIDLLKAYFKVHERETHREIREKVTGKLLTLDRTLEPTLPALLALLDVPTEDAQWHALDPPQRRRRTLDAVKRLLLRESQMQPLLVIFEDLHWIDGETEALLDGLIDSLPTARFLLLVNYRPEYQHGWGSKTYYTQLRLDALPPESADELLLALLGTDPTVEPLMPILIARTGGNPLFLEESVRTLVEINALVGERGAYRLARPLDTIRVPSTVQAILASRIDRLDPQDKQLLQTASVVGKDVPFAYLLAIAKLSEEDLRRGLAHLQAAEFLYESALFPELEYTFKHALTHEVTYGGMLLDRRRGLHARMVEVIESRHGDRLAEQVERLANHAARGEVWAKAAQYTRQAGDRAAALCADAEAVAYYERALETLTHGPVTRESAREAIDVRFALRAPLWRGGHLDRLHAVFREVEQLAALHDETERLDVVYSFFVQYHWAKGEYEQGIQYSERCLETGARRGDLGLQVTGHYYAGGCRHARGELRTALQHFRWIITALDGGRETERFGLSGLPFSGACALAAECLSDLGDVVAADDLLGRGEAVASAANHLYSTVPLAIMRGRLLLEAGDTPGAIRVLEPAVAVCREHKFAGQTMRALTPLGEAYTAAGRAGEAVPLLREAIALQEAAGAFVTRALWVRTLAEALRCVGRLDEAATTAQSALDFAVRLGERGNEAWTHFVLAEIAADRGRVAEAREHLAFACEASGRLEMSRLAARCDRALAALATPQASESNRP